MIKIFKYLKPYILSVIVIAALLYLQANMELALPDYMSRIVNVGIQQGGIDSAIPKTIRVSEMNKLTVFMDTDSKKLIKDLFIESEGLYVLNSKLEFASNDLNHNFGKAFMAKSALEQISPENILLTLTEGTRKNLPQDIDIFSLISYMPDKPRELLIKTVLNNVSEIDNMIIEQKGIISVKAEYIIIGLDTQKTQSTYIMRIGAMMLLFTLISAIATIIVGLLSARTSAGLARTLRRDVFTKVENFSGEEFDKFSTASLITRSTNDITQIQMLIFIMLRMMLYAPILGIGGVFRANNKAPSMAWIIGLSVFILLLLVIIVFIIAIPKYKKIQKFIDRLNLIARENLSGLMVVRAFNQQDFEEDRFDQANQNLTKTNLFILRVMVIMMPVMMLVMNLISVIIIWVGAKQVAASNMQIGDMMAFMQYAMQIVMSFLMMTMIFIFLPRAAVSANRVNEVLQTDPVIKDPENPIKIPIGIKGVIEFCNVGFRYPGAEENALFNLNFVAKPGLTTAIIGATGAGKSTIVNLIPRFYDVSQGKILIDGINIKDLSQSDLRNQIGYVPQKITLFSGTIESNLRYADDNVSEKTIREASEAAQVLEFINTREQAFNAPISQSGTNISGGQKQRLSIARALVKYFPVLIFDDSFSALDFKTDAALRKALKKQTGESTIIIIAQRISTIMSAEQIIVLDEGRIVGKGTHNELLNSCQEYKEIALSQLDMEELV
jgi:ATP-binding cassette, subfamily B, multidrug efflux pump